MLKKSNKSVEYNISLCCFLNETPHYLRGLRLIEFSSNRNVLSNMAVDKELQRNHVSNHIPFLNITVEGFNIVPRMQSVIYLRFNSGLSHNYKVKIFDMMLEGSFYIVKYYVNSHSDIKKIPVIKFSLVNVGKVKFSTLSGSDLF